MKHSLMSDTKRCYSYIAHSTECRERQFILHNHKYIITKELLDNIGWWPEGTFPSMLAAHNITTLLRNQIKKKLMISV